MADNQYKLNVIYAIIAGIIAVALTAAFFINIGFAPALIIGGSAIIAWVVWLLTTYKRPVDPQKILPLYLLALTVQIIHTVEEYVADFPGEFSAAFNLQLFDRNLFAIIVLGVFASVWVFTAFGLTHRNPLANYFLWFFLIGPGLVNAVAHFAFPIIKRRIYFPGLITVLLPTVASIWVIRAIMSGIKAEEAGH